MKLHPFQELKQTKHGEIRFRENKIVRWLANGKLNDIANMDFPVEDVVQFNQLIGYSAFGYCSLNKIPEHIKDVVEQEAGRLSLGVVEEDPQVEIQRLRVELALKNRMLEQIKSILSGEIFDEDTSDAVTPG